MRLILYTAGHNACRSVTKMATAMPYCLSSATPSATSKSISGWQRMATLQTNSAWATSLRRMTAPATPSRKLPPTTAISARWCSAARSWKTCPPRRIAWRSNGARHIIISASSTMWRFPSIPLCFRLATLPSSTSRTMKPTSLGRAIATVTRCATSRFHLHLNHSSTKTSRAAPCPKAGPLRATTKTRPRPGASALAIIVLEPAPTAAVTTP